MKYMVISSRSGVLDNAYLLAAEGHDVTLISSDADPQFADRFNLNLENSIFQEEDSILRDITFNAKPTTLPKEYISAVKKTNRTLIEYALNNKIERIVSDSIYHALYGLAELAAETTIEYIGPDASFARTEIYRFEMRQKMQAAGTDLPPLIYEGNAKELDLKKIDLPAVVKSKRQFFIKAKVCKTEDQLSQIVSLHGDSEIYIEELIEGEEYLSYYWITPSKKGGIDFQAITVDTEKADSVGATSSSGEYFSSTDDPLYTNHPIWEITTKSCHSVGFMNLIRDKNNKWFFLENNARPPLYDSFAWMNNVHDFYTKLINNTIETKYAEDQAFNTDWLHNKTLILYRGDDTCYIPEELETGIDKGVWLTRNQYISHHNDQQKTALVHPAILFIGAPTADGLNDKVQHIKQLLSSNTGIIVEG